MIGLLRHVFSNKRPQNEYQDITQHEIEALTYEYNLADAHTHQSQSPTQQEIVKLLPKIWYNSEKKKQVESEERFIETFFRVQKQPTALKTPTLLVYAASIGMVITANYLMKKNLSVALYEPCFDNLRDIMQHMQIKMETLREEWFHDPTTLYDNLKKNVRADAVFIVDPNNPTGFTLFSFGKQAYKELIRYAKDYNKLLIFDFCFASFMLPDRNLDVFDVYEMLEASEVLYIAMEDVGKTWPLQDAKVALIKTSKDVYPDVYNIHTAYLLNVSPFILNLVTEYILDSEQDGFSSVYDLLERNRNIAIKELDGSILELQKSASKVSVAWCKITDPSIDASELQEAILKEGVYVLPGRYFFWNNPEEGERFIRIALARNTDMFQAAMKKIRKALDTYANTSAN